jgi:hypothetical protein
MEWIKVIDRLPEESGYYIYHRNGIVDKTYYDVNEKYWFCGSGVTEWMQFPEPPQGA